MLTVDWNPWLACAVTMTLRWFLPGLAWGWVLESADSERRGWRESFLSPIRSLIVGVTASILVAWLLAELGCYTPLAEWCALVAVSLPGCLLGWRAGAGGWMKRIRFNAAAIAVVFLSLVTVMNLPSRGVWILGGWDPGVYVNQGIYVARTGTFHPLPDEVLQTLTPSEFEMSGNRRGAGYWELFDGVTADTETRALRFYFFRTTPAFVATLCRDGGLRAACRVNDFAGILALLFFAGWVARSTGSLAVTVPSLALLAVQPVFLYHTHTPVSEMLELALVSAAGFLVASREGKPAASGVLALVLFAATLNRISFVATGGVLLVVLAILDLRRSDRRGVWLEHAGLAAGVAAGLVIDIMSSGMIPRLGHVLPSVLWMSAMLFLLAGGINALGGRFRRGGSDSEKGLWLLVAIPVVSLIVGVGWAVRTGVIDAIPITMVRLAQFSGWPVVVLAYVGAGIGALKCRQWFARGPGMAGFLAVLAAAAVALICQKWVAELYPWATKRFLSNAVPLLAVLAALGPACLWIMGGRRLILRWLAVALVTIAVFVTIPKSARAWTRTEHDGVSKALALVSAELKDDDVVFVEHARWGTPLLFIHGRKALLAAGLWDGSGQLREDSNSFLERLAKRGGRVRFMTSSADESAPMLPPNTTGPDWTSAPFFFREIVHSPRAHDYRLRDRRFVFRLYTWRTHEPVR